MNENYDWSEAEEAGDIVQRTAFAVAVYVNESGDIAIRQDLEAHTNSDDAVIVVSRANVIFLIKKLKSLLTEGLDDS